MGEVSCQQCRELAAELALNMLPARERDEALAHLDRCPGCRDMVSALTVTGDRLVELLPGAEPPVGFEQRVITTLTSALPTVGHAGWVVNENTAERLSAGMPVRLASPDDAGEVVRLAGLLYEAIGIDASGEAWRRLAADQLCRRLGDSVMVAVVDDPARCGRLAAAGAGIIAVRLPGPDNPSARVGYIQWICTDIGWRRRGLARAITVTLLDWFAAQQVHSVELHATPDAEPLYRALGFGQGRNPALRIQLDPKL